MNSLIVLLHILITMLCSICLSICFVFKMLKNMIFYGSISKSALDQEQEQPHCYEWLRLPKCVCISYPLTLHLLSRKTHCAKNHSFYMKLNLMEALASTWVRCYLKR